MKHVPLLIIIIVISIFIGKSFDIKTYTLHHKKSISKTVSVPEEQTFVGNVSVVASPSDEKWLLSIIDKARKEIKIAVYMFTVPSIMDALLRAKNRGVDVKVLLEKNPYNAQAINSPAIQFFEKNNIPFHQTSNQIFSFMHAKYAIIDQDWIISTANWTRSSFSSHREFFLLGDDLVVRDDIKKIFEADFGDMTGFTNDNRLIVGPTNAREKIIHFISSSEKTIQIYMPSITDSAVILEIQNQCKNGKNVSILLDGTEENIEGIYKMKQKSCPDVRLMNKPSLHAKSVIIDKEEGFIGSFNFTKNSLENNREIGIFINGEGLKYIVNKFESDWKNSIAF